MVSISYDVNGATRVNNSLRTLATKNRKITDKVVGQWAKETRAKVKGTKYPPQTNKPQPFKTAKQRRFFFWALANGIITVPYRRTGRLANSWSARQNSLGNWSIANSTSYAHWVVDRSSQSGYHAGNWWIAQDIIDAEVPQLTKDLASELSKVATGSP